MNEGFSGFSKNGGIVFFSELVFVRDIANDHGSLECSRFRLERNVAGNHALNLFFRQSIAQQQTRNPRPAVTVNGKEAFRDDEREDDCEDRWGRLKENVIKRADPGKTDYFNDQREHEPAQPPPPRSRQSHPGDADR